MNERQVRDWRKQKRQLQSLPSKKKRLEGGGRKATFPGLESDLVTWIDVLGAENVMVTRADVQQKALELNQGTAQAKFTASNGWLDNFLKRNHLSLQRRAKVSEKLSQNVTQTATESASEHPKIDADNKR